MTLWFRLIAVVFAALFSRTTVETLAETRLRLRVWPKDVDINVHMTNARYLEIFDLGRVDLMLRQGFGMAIAERKWSPVIAGCSVRFRRALRPFERFTLRTRLVGWDARWFYIEHIVENREGIVASALVRGAFLEAGRTLAPAEVMSILGKEVESPELPDAILAWQDADAALHPA